jgi:HD-GYP domain-containing protein (c-di-GMP phosphodiesterase class II)
VARQLAPRLGLPHAFAGLFDQIFERWDGKGVPRRLRADTIALPVRIVQVAHGAETYLRYAGREGAVTLLRERAGGALDPGLVRRFSDHASIFFDSVEIPSPWASVLEREPGGQTWLQGSDMDEALRAMADFADLKSPHTIGHSRRVADLAATAAQRCGMPEPEVTVLRRAAWLHDLGRVAISAAVWEKSERLADRDWEAIRLHPYYTERMTSRAPRLAPLGAIAALHHERLDPRRSARPPGRHGRA